nr:hypothetical protein [Tanacetum cinerariifolium]
MSIPSQDAPSIKRPVNDPIDFANSVKAISLPQDVPSTSDCPFIELENQVQLLMEAHLVPNQPIQVNKITFSCEIYSSPHDTKYCMENPEQAFVEYASSRTSEMGVKKKKEKSLDYNNSFLGEYECSSLALDREEMRDVKEEIESLETRSNNALACREDVGVDLLEIARSIVNAFIRVFDGVFGGVGDEEVVVGESMVVTSSSLEMLTNSYLGEIMVSLIFLEGLEKEAFEEFMVELFEEDDKMSKKYGLFN